MTRPIALHLSIIAGIASFALCLGARAQGPGAGNLLGHRGMLRSVSASNHPSGHIGLTTDFQYYSVGDFLANGEDHSRMVNSYAIVWAPFRLAEAAFALHVISDKSTVGSKEELMVAVGDPEISLKAGGELGRGFALGGLLDLRFPSGAGFFQPSLSATSFLFAALASWSAGRVPLSFHLNLGFQYDGTKNLFDSPNQLTSAQLYAAQVSSFHRFITRVGAEYNTRYVGPFLELSLEPFVGGDAPGFGDSPGILSFGLRAWPTKTKSVQLLAAVDIGITGVGQGEPTLPAGSTEYAYVLPRWNLLFQASYRFDAYAKPGEVRVEAPPPPPPPEPPKQGIAEGKVLDAETSKPVWNAQVQVRGQEASRLAVDPRDGTFRTYLLTEGKYTIVAEAEGYAASEIEVAVTRDAPASATLRLKAKTTALPGTLRGMVKALVGKNPKEATILIPELDKTVQVDASGEFSLQIPGGEYKVVVSAPGFRTQTKQIRVLEGSTVILNVELHK